MSLEVTEEFLLSWTLFGIFNLIEGFSIWFSCLLEKGRETNPALYLILVHRLFLKDLKSEGWVCTFVTIWLRDSSSTTLLWCSNQLNRQLLRLVSFQWPPANFWNIEEHGMNFSPVVPNNSFFSFLYCRKGDLRVVTPLPGSFLLQTLKEGAGHLKSGPLPDCSMLNCD